MSRSGRAPKWAIHEPWAREVTWKKCDAMDEASCREVTAGASALVTAIGALPFPWHSADDIVRANGETNIIPGRSAIVNDVKRMVVIGATIPPFVPGLASYARGKSDVENFASREFANVEQGRRAVVLKPAAVSGTRRISSSGFGVPLSVFMDPVRFVIGCTRIDSLLEHAPVPLEAVALAAAKAALDDAYDGGGYTVISNAALIQGEF